MPFGPTTTNKYQLRELAVRLGSVDILDREGNVIWFDDFADGINKWTLGDLTWSADEARYGGYSGKMVTAAVAGDMVTAFTKLLCFSTPGILGFEFSFCHSGEIREIRLIPSLYYGDYAYGPTVGWRRSTQRLYYMGLDGLPHDLPNYESFGDGEVWHTIKLVVDGINGKYVRVLSDSRTYIVTDKCPTTLPTGSYAIDMCIEVETNWDAALTTYLAGAIITQNEPAITVG